MTWLRIVLFVLALVALFVSSGVVLDRASGTPERVLAAEGVSVETGEQIFWSYGKCHTCHAVGTRGQSIRGPNLGDGPDGPPIGVRAAERARQRLEADGRSLSATDYLVESLLEPSAHIVQGFKDEMPPIHDPPIALDSEELTAVVLYLQAQGGEPDLSEIDVPPGLGRTAAGADGAGGWEPYMEGDSVRGRRLFFATDGPAACAKCHRVGESGGEIGPELTGIAGIRDPQFILRAILDPGAEIASGYETELIQTTDGRLMDGVVVRESEDSLWIADANGDVTGLETSAVARRRTEDVSIMPENLDALLTVGELHDLLAYLRTLR